MKQEELNKILEEHKLWLENKGERGIRANLEYSNLQGLNLEGVNLECVHLRGVNLKGANLKGANLKGAFLYYANLQGANLEGADLKGVTLNGSKLKDAKFTTEIRNVGNFAKCCITEDQLCWFTFHPKFSELYTYLVVS